MTLLDLVAYVVGIVGLAIGVGGWRLAHRWAKDCRECRIIIAEKSRVVLDASLVEWLSWNRALPHRERSRGGIIFRARGISVALARPKLGAAATSQKTRTVKTPAASSSSSKAAAS